MFQTFKETFQGGHNLSGCQEQLKKQRQSLLTRAWIFHTIKTCLMIVYATLGKAYWEEKYLPDPTHLPYNTSIIIKLGNFPITLIWALLGTGILLNLICWW